MMKKTPHLNLRKYVLIALIVFLIGYVFLDESQGSPVEYQLAETETTFIEAGTDDILRDSIVDFGIELLDTPYVTAGSGREGFDCSGFVYFVFQNFEINVPRSTSGYGNFGSEIPLEEVQKGDLLLFLSPTRNAIGHIGIITDANGSESDFIHASSGKQMKVIITNLSNEGYTRRFVKAIRVL